MNRRHMLSLTALSLLGLAACEDAPPLEETTPLLPTGAQDLEVGAGAELSLDASGEWLTDGPDGLVIPVVDGALTMRIDADDAAVIEDLVVAFGDYEVGTSMLTPDGGALTDVKLVLDGAQSLDLREDAGEMVGSARLPMRLEWGLSLGDDEQMDLGSPRIANLPAEIFVGVDETGRLYVDLAVGATDDPVRLEPALTVHRANLRLRASAGQVSDAKERGGV